MDATLGSDRLSDSESPAAASHRESVFQHACVRPSAPGFALSSAAGQAVGPLPHAAHQRQGFAAALLQGGVRHVPVRKADLRGAKERAHDLEAGVRWISRPASRDGLPGKWPSRLGPAPPVGGRALRSR